MNKEQFFMLYTDRCTLDGEIFMKGREIPQRYCHGYKGFCIYINGKDYWGLSHRLIYTWFYGFIPEGYEIDHIDGNRDNNHPSNLRAVTHSENIKYAIIRLGNWNKGKGYGSENGRAKLTEIDIPIIRQRLATGETQELIAADYGVNRATISYIKLNKTWNVNKEKK